MRCIHFVVKLQQLLLRVVRNSAINSHEVLTDTLTHSPAVYWCCGCVHCLDVSK